MSKKTRQKFMSVLVISGISGAGKSIALHTLEDIGYYCIDNLPPALLVAVSKLNGNKQLAVTIDFRSVDHYDVVLEEIQHLKEEKIETHSLFLYCEKEVVLKRYKQTRRKHPLISNQYPSLQQAIEYENQLCQSAMEHFDTVIDTSFTSQAQFRKMIIDTFQQADFMGLTLKLISFGYKNGLPSEADLIYDVRCLPNPYYLVELRDHTGLENCVDEYVFSFSQSNEFLEKVRDFIVFALPYYIQEGKNELVIGIGCTSGHHRSVSFAQRLAQQLQFTKHKIVLIHRDIEKDF